jgi:hypothetical protein
MQDNEIHNVVAARRAIAIYINQDNTISVCQENPYENDPTIIVIHPDDVECIIDALRKKMREIKNA